MPDKTASTLSVCMIVKNEAAVLERCLASIRPAADEIVVADTGSTDSTADIARRFGATVVLCEWRDDFAYARNISLEHATGDWILWLDADDVVPEESAKALARLKCEAAPDTVYAFVIRNEKPGNIGSEFMQARMFPNRRGIRFERRIHEQMTPSALRRGMKLVNVPIVIEHHGYGDPAEMKKKARRNVALLVEEFNPSLPDPVTAVEIGDSYTILEDYDNAAAWYEKTLGIEGCEKTMPAIASQAHLGLGVIGNKREDYESAIVHCMHAVRLCPERPDALYSLAVAYDLSGRKQEAIDTLRRILASTAKETVQVGIDFRQATVKACIRLGAILGAEGRFEELAAHVQATLAHDGERPEIQNMAGAAYYRQGRLMEALHAYEKSLQIRTPGNIDAYIGLCAIYRMAGRIETLNTTLELIRPMFIGSPRYWAFVELAKGSDAGIPADIDRLKIEQEKKYLDGLFGLTRHD